MMYTFSQKELLVYSERIKFYKSLETTFNGKIISYITGDKQGFETQIASDVIDLFISHLDRIGPVQTLILYLYTRGGDTSAAWNIVNLLRMYCEELIVVIPHKAHSSGTIISLGADKIIMTKQATLSPIDPSVNHPLNPHIPGAPEGVGFPVSVEAVKGYIDLAKEEIGIKKEALSSILNNISEKVHPLILGQVFRSRAQIKMLATRLLEKQMKNNPEGIKKVTAFLCSDSGSHDYTINRREAKESLGLNVDKPTNYQYHIIKDLYDNFSEELELGMVFNPALINGAFSMRRVFVESIDGGSDFFVTEGRSGVASLPNGTKVNSINKTFEGWRHQNPSTEKNEVFIATEQEKVKYEKDNNFSI